MYAGTRLNHLGVEILRLCCCQRAVTLSQALYKLAFSALRYCPYFSSGPLPEAALMYTVSETHDSNIVSG